MHLTLNPSTEIRVTQSSDMRYQRKIKGQILCLYNKASTSIKVMAYAMFAVMSALKFNVSCPLLFIEFSAVIQYLNDLK